MVNTRGTASTRTRQHTRLRESVQKTVVKLKKPGRKRRHTRKYCNTKNQQKQDNSGLKPQRGRRQAKSPISIDSDDDDDVRYMLADDVISLKNSNIRTEVKRSKSNTTSQAKAPGLWSVNSLVKPVPRIPIAPYSPSPSSQLTQSDAYQPSVGKLNSKPEACNSRIRQLSPRKLLGSKFLEVRLSTSAVPPKYIDNEIQTSFSSVCKKYKLGPAMNKKYNKTSRARRLRGRQSESCVYKYTDITVKKTHNFTQVILDATSKKQKNTLTVKALQELTSVLNHAKYDTSSKLLLLTGSDNGTFCSGLDLTYLTSGDVYHKATIMSDSLSEFVRAMLAFPKPLIAAVNGKAIGCGVAILPLCDIVYANDKAMFFTPYTQLGQIPEAGLTCTLSQIVGIALANEMLMAGRVLTALEAYQMGLISQVFWPTNMMQEVIPRVVNIAACSSQILNSTKSLIKSQNREKLLSACHMEAAMLAEIWPTDECQKGIKLFIDNCNFL